MAEDRRKQPLGIGARQRELVGVADAGGLDLDQHLARAGSIELDGRDLQRLAGGNSDSGANVHGGLHSKGDMSSGGGPSSKRALRHST
jgi:hypothetical protein